MVQFTVLSTGVEKMQRTHTKTVEHTHTMPIENSQESVLQHTNTNTNTQINMQYLDSHLSDLQGV